MKSIKDNSETVTKIHELVENHQEHKLKYFLPPFAEPSKGKKLHQKTLTFIN